MSESILNLLLVDDEDSVREPLAQHLQAEPYKYVVKDVANVENALKSLEETGGHFDVALIDEVMKEGASGLDLLRQIKNQYPQIECILFTGWGMQSGLEALRAGAYRYFAKPFNLEELALTIRFAADQKLLQREREYLSTLVQVSRELTQTTDLEEQLRLVWNYVQERLATPTFFIALYDSGTDTLQFHQSYDEGEPDPLPDRNLGTDPSGWGVAGYTVKTGDDQVWFNREQALQEWHRLDIKPYISGKGPSKSGICLPLQVGKKVLGALSVQSYEHNAFDQAFLDAVRTLASHLAPAIENARLFQEIKQRTTEVEITRDHLDRLVASSFDGIITIDTAAIVTGFNAMAERILGYRAIEVLGKPVHYLYYDPEEPRRIGWLLRQTQDGKLTDHETNVKSKHGDKIPIRLSATWLFDTEGNTIGSAGFFRDVRRIQETEMQRHQLLETSKVLAQATSLNGGLQSLSKIIADSCNMTFCSILLLAPDDKKLIVRAAQLSASSDEQIWDPGIDKVCTPFQRPGAAKFIRSGEPVILRKGRRGANQVLRHLAEEIKLPAPLHSILIVPLRTDEKHLGICLLGEMRMRDQSTITEREIELAQSLANQAAIFVEKMRLHELTRQRAELLEALENLSLTISASLNLDEILNKTCQAAVELFGVDHSGLVLFDSNYLHGKVVAEYPANTNTIGTEIPLENVPIEAKLIKYREPISVFDIENEEKLGGVREILYNKFDIHSTVLVPVISKGELFGSFSLDAIGHKRLFTREEIELCKIFTAHVASAVENARLHQETEQRKQLLETLEEASRHIRAEKEPVKLLQEIVRLAAELMGCTASGLFINHSHLGVLELIAAHGLPEDVPIHQIFHGDGLIGSVAKFGEPKIIHTYSNWDNREAVFEPFEFSTVAGMPLKRAGDVIAVLFVADSSVRLYDNSDLEILERFAAQASIALHTSQLMDKEQRGLSQLAILHRISDYLQEAKEQDRILHVVLTGVTAGYGLGFNRAALLLLDESRKNLVGRMGIGQLTEAEAWADWERDHQYGFDDFGRYLEALEQGTLLKMPVDERIRELRLATGSESPDIFSRTIQEQRWKLIEQDGLDALPDDFVTAFEPEFPLAVIPIIARERVLGILVADNKFTRAPITSEDIELLLTFASTAALAIDNVQLFQEAETAREKIRTLFEASNALVLSQATKQLLKDVIDKAQRSAGASWVSIVLVDEMRRARSLFTTGTDKKVDISDVVRPNGITMQVVHNGEAAIIENTQLYRPRVNPGMFHNKVAAALCLPFSVQGKRIGVMWIHYDESRYFRRYEIESLQLFANQAAVAYDSARRMEELEHMRQAVETLSGAAELDEVLKQIVQSAKDVLGADSVAIRSFNAILDEFVPEGSVSIDIPKNLWEKFRKEEPRKQGTARTIMQQGWIGVEDVTDEKRYPYIGGRTKELLQEIGAQSVQGIALTVGNENLGVLYLNYKYGRSFGKEDQRVAITFANHAALALKKARLLDDLEHALKQVIHVRNTARVVAEVTALEELDETLDSIVKGTQGTLKCDVVTLYTYDEERDEFSFPPAMVGVRQEAKVLEIGFVARDSVLYDVIKLNDLYVASHTESDPLMGSPFSAREGVKSTIGVPLIARNRKVGLLFVNYRSHHRFTEEELVNIRLFAHQAAVAIRNAQLFDQERKRAVVLEALHNSGKAVASLLSLDEILERIAEQAWYLVRQRASYTSIRLVEKEIATLVAAFPPQELDHRRATIPEINLKTGVHGRFGVTGRAIRTGAPQLVVDVRTDNDYLSSQPDARSELAVPIILGEGVIGVINAESPEIGSFDEEDERTLVSLASFAAIAINDAQLHERAKKQAETLDGLYRAGKTVTSLPALDEILQVIAQQAWYLVGRRASYTIIRLVENHIAKVVAAYPAEKLINLPVAVPEIDIVTGVDGKIGVTGRAIKTGNSQLVNDVSSDSDYIPSDPHIQSELAVPITLGEHILGVINVDSLEKQAFSENDRRTLKSLAGYAAIAINNAQLHEKTLGQAETLGGLYEAGKSITRTLVIDEVLEHIVEQALRIVRAKDKKGCFSHVALFDKEKLRFVKSFPLGILQDLHQNIGELDLQKDGQMGIVGYVAFAGQTQNIEDVTKDPRYLPLRENIGVQSQLSVPIKIGEKVIGVLSIEHAMLSAFNSEDVISVELLAAQASLAIQNARRYSELQKMYHRVQETKAILAGRTALAWTGMISSTWRHAIEKHAITIREQIGLLRNDTIELPIKSSIEKRLNMMERLANQILKKPLTAPLSAEEEVQSVHLNMFIQQRCNQLWVHEPYKAIERELHFKLDNHATIRANPDWLQRALDILIDNAVDATDGLSKRKITVSTKRTYRRAIISIGDNGQGIPIEIRERLFREPIAKPKGAKGLGMGLLFAQMIIQTYAGKITIGTTGTKGTTLVISLPLER